MQKNIEMHKFTSTNLRGVNKEVKGKQHWKKKKCHKCSHLLFKPCYELLLLYALNFNCHENRRYKSLSWKEILVFNFI